MFESMGNVFRSFKGEVVAVCAVIAGFYTVALAFFEKLYKSWEEIGSLYASLILVVVAVAVLSHVLSAKMYDGRDDPKFGALGRTIAALFLVISLVIHGYCVYLSFITPSGFTITNRHGDTVPVDERDLKYLEDYNRKGLTAVSFNRKVYDGDFDHEPLERASDYLRRRKKTTPLDNDRLLFDVWQEWMEAGNPRPSPLKVTDYDTDFVVYQLKPFKADFETIIAEVSSADGVRISEGSAFLVWENPDDDVYQPTYRQVLFNPSGDERPALATITQPNDKEYLLMFLKVQGKQQGQPLPDDIALYELKLRRKTK